MFEVLAFVYENYWGGDACPELPALQRKLHAVGFDSQEVVAALVWLEDLKSAAHGVVRPPATSALAETPLIAANDSGAKLLAAHTMRVLTVPEQNRLGMAGWRFLNFLCAIGALPQDRLELVMERAMATAGDPLSLEDVKLIVLMVYWSLGEDPDALVLDELCDNRPFRLAS